VLALPTHLQQQSRRYSIHAAVTQLPKRSEGVMKSLVVKRSVAVAGHKTSVCLEEAFWESLKEIAKRQGVTVSALLAAIDSGRHHGNLSSAIRLFVLNFYRDQLDIQDGRTIQGALGGPVAGFESQQEAAENDGLDCAGPR
jgi:predicted DNA-binding ribbon-helix-helix protein